MRENLRISTMMVVGIRIH